MNWFTSFFTGGASTVVDSVGSALDNLFTSDEERLEADRLMELVKDKPNQDQRDTNKIEAASGNGWRHWVGRIGAVALGIFYIPQYTIAAIVWARACWDVVPDPITGLIVFTPYPVKGDSLTELIYLMLGVGAVKGAEVISGKRKAK